MDSEGNNEPPNIWEFDTTIEYHDFGRMGYTVVYLPEPLRAELPFDKYPRLRVNADILGYSIEGAFQPGQGKIYLILSKKCLKALDIMLGDVVTVQFSIADQNSVTVPPELSSALRKNAAAHKAWEALTPGKQRAYAHSINSAKTKPTLEKRVQLVISELGGLTS